MDMNIRRKHLFKRSGNPTRGRASPISARDVAGGLWNRQTRLWLVVAAVLAVAGCAGAAVAASVQSAQNAQRGAPGVHGVLGAGRVDAEAGDPARAGSDRERGRLRGGQSPRVEHAVRALGDARCAPWRATPRSSASATRCSCPHRRSRRSRPRPSAIPSGRCPRRHLRGRARRAGAVLLLRRPGSAATPARQSRRRVMTSATGRWAARPSPRATRATSAYVPIRIGAVTLLAVSRRRCIEAGWCPPTVAAAARLPRLGRPASIRARVLLGQALAGHPDIAVAFSYHGRASQRRVPRRHGPRGAQSIDDRPSQRLDGADLRACRRRPACSPTAGPARCWSAGSSSSLLLGALVFVLGTGRARARRLVSVEDRRAAPPGAARRADRACPTAP